VNVGATRIGDAPSDAIPNRLIPRLRFSLLTDRATLLPDGSDPRPVSADKEHVINTGDWSPDGDYVVGRKRLTDQSSIGTVELWLYHRMGGNGVQVTKKDGIPDANDPTFSPDGRWIYFAARDRRYQYNRNVYEGIWQIRGYDRKTGNFRPLTDGYGGSARPRDSPRHAGQPTAQCGQLAAMRELPPNIHEFVERFEDRRQLEFKLG
jgi:hypothetical protein